jgi:hypothetical protein
VGHEAALATAQEDARASLWGARLETPVLARLVSLGAIEGIEAADHPLVWIVVSSDARFELLLVISGTDGSIVYSQVTGVDPP